MEPISFTLAVGSLVGIFRASVDCFRFVHLGRQFETDYQVSCLQLDDAQLRLTRWGAIVGLTEHREVQPLDGHAPPRFKERAQERLELIQKLFSNAEKLSAKYASAHSDRTVARGGQSSETKDLSISKRVQAICLRRSSALNQRTKWALHRREDFNDLLTKVNHLLDGLFELLPQDNRTLTKLCDREASDLKNETDLAQLREVVAEHDPALEAALAKIQQATGNTVTFNNYDNTKITNMAQWIKLEKQEIKY